MAKSFDKIMKTYYDPSLFWTGTFKEYIEIIKKNPSVADLAWKRLYSMIISYGSEDLELNNKSIKRYPFFDDPDGNGRDAIFGIEETLFELVSVIKAAALNYGAQKRIILLHGPVGSSKSSIVRLFKKGLERYSKKDEGAIYSFTFNIDGEAYPCPLNQDPLSLIPKEIRQEIFEALGVAKLLSQDQIDSIPELNPQCNYWREHLLKKYNYDFHKMLEHVEIRRVLLSESNRVGIGSFQPRDEKNQDSTELTGDLNYKKIAEYGSESDPRAFNFDGEFCVANRGIMEFVEMLKLDVAFLYDLLTATQERKMKPKNFPQTDIDEVIIGHTNEAEYNKLMRNEFMEALKDRMIKIDIPYITKWDDEIRIYKRDFAQKNIGKHIAPHTVEMAALWAVLSRLAEPEQGDLTKMQKLKLYNGNTVQGYTSESLGELKKNTKNEGLIGVSPRFIQDAMSRCLVNPEAKTGINVFILMSELIRGVETSPLFQDKQQKLELKALITEVRQEFEEIVKNEVQQAISADEGAVNKLCANYVDNIKAYVQRTNVYNKYTQQREEPNEQFMRSIEEKINIPESRKDNFRQELLNFIGALAVESKTFNSNSNARLRRALELKLFEDKKDSIKLSSILSNIVDRETQDKIDVIKKRMIERFGYNDESATDVLNFVASIFARGDVK